jgi:hypothetical protein
MSQDLFQQADGVRKQAYKTLNKDEKSVEEDVAVVKQWLKTQHHLPEVMSDPAIRNFLLMNKFSVESTKQKIDMYYTMRTLLPDLYGNPTCSQIKDFMDDMFVCFHPVPMQGLYKVFLYKAKRPNILSLRKLAVVVNSIAEVRLMKDCMYRDIMILDMENITVNDIAKITPPLIAEIFTIYAKVFSLRLEAIYLLNAPSFVLQLMAMLKSVLKPKIFNRIEVHQDTEVLTQIFTSDDLPKDYGGNGPSLQELNDLVMLMFEDHQERFDQLDKLKIDENLRVEKLNRDEILGVRGDFKKLEVD